MARAADSSTLQQPLAGTTPAPSPAVPAIDSSSTRQTLIFPWLENHLAQTQPEPQPGLLSLGKQKGCSSHSQCANPDPPHKFGVLSLSMALHCLQRQKVGVTS